MTSQASASPAATAAASSSSAPRLDFYGPIHKALRVFMADTLARVGRLDVDDDADREQTCLLVQALLQQMRSHLLHENEFVHTALEARRPGAAARTHDDHLLHVDAIGNLDDEALALRQARPAQRPALAQRLYRQLALFVAHNLEHMAVEESDNSAALWALYTDAELAALHDQLLATIGPAEMALTLRWMARSLAPQELAGLFGDLRSKAPPEAFDALYDLAVAELDAPRRAKLARALGLPPVAGLVSA